MELSPCRLRRSGDDSTYLEDTQAFGAGALDACHDVREGAAAVDVDCEGPTRSACHRGWMDADKTGSVLGRLSGLALRVK